MWVCETEDTILPYDEDVLEEKGYFHADVWDADAMDIYSDNELEEIIAHARKCISKKTDEYGLCAYVLEKAMSELSRRKRLDFLDDHEKMIDLFTLTKEEFLEFYHYLTEEEYDATMNKAIEKSGYWHQDWYRENPDFDGKKLRHILFGIMVTEWLARK